MHHLTRWSRTLTAQRIFNYLLIHLLVNIFISLRLLMLFIYLNIVLLLCWCVLFGLIVCPERDSVRRRRHCSHTLSLCGPCSPLHRSAQDSSAPPPHPSPLPPPLSQSAAAKILQDPPEPAGLKTPTQSAAFSLFD